MTPKKLDFWIKNNYNVLFSGHHGVGKTAKIIEAFNRNGLKWKYFSASTLDPWVDFCGIPKEITDENGKSYIDLIRPKCFAEDEVEAIFLDEYNRANSKVQNSTMELIQFKSINGRKFNNLKFIWAAINPPKTNDSDIEYSVEKLDPAQIDRFQIYVEIPYKLSVPYFIHKFGENVALIAANWWNELTESDKMGVSPRRLDYALDVYIAGGDIRDVVPKNINVNKLVNELSNGSYRSRLEKIFEDKNNEAAKAFLDDVNCLDNTLSYIVKNDEYLSFFLPHIPNESRAQLAVVNKNVLTHMISNIASYGPELNILSKTDAKIKKAMANIAPVDNSKFDKLTFSKCDYTRVIIKGTTPDSHFSKLSDLLDFNKELNTTAARRGAYYDLVSFLHIKCGYFLSNVPIDNSPIQLSTDDILQVINFLNSIIDSTRSFGSYNKIEEIYGAMCRIYYMRGRVQNYSALSGNVKWFILEYVNAYA